MTGAVLNLQNVHEAYKEMVQLQDATKQQSEETFYSIMAEQVYHISSKNSAPLIIGQKTSIFGKRNPKHLQI